MRRARTIELALTFTTTSREAPFGARRTFFTATGGGVRSRLAARNAPTILSRCTATDKKRVDAPSYGCFVSRAILTGSVGSRSTIETKRDA
jgi:hypothetical protein